MTCNKEKCLSHDLLTSLTVDWLRFPLAVIVVILHNEVRIDPHGLLFNCEFLLIHRTIGRIAVPMFFLFAGYYFFFNKHGFSLVQYRQQIYKRIQTIMIPYFVFNTLEILYFYASQGSFDLGYDIYYAYFNRNAPYHYSIRGLLDWPGICPIAGQLWYLRDLFILAILSPIVYKYIMVAKKNGILFLFALYLINFNTVIPYISGIFYFSLGAYFSINQTNMVLWFRKIKTIYPIILCLGTFIYMVISRDYLNVIQLFTISFIILVLQFVSEMIKKGYLTVNKTLAKGSYFVYLTVGFFNIIPIDNEGYFLPIHNQIIEAIQYILIPIICASLSVSVYYILKKYIPFTLVFLTGEAIKK